MNKTKSGFTIVELLIVIVVIGILAAITIVAYNGIQQRGRDAKRIDDVAKIVKAMRLWGIDTTADFNTSNAGSSGGTVGWFDTVYSPYISVKALLVASGNLSDGVVDPINSKTGNTYAYMVSPCNSSTTEPRKRVVLARLENVPAQTVTQQIGTTCSSGTFSTYFTSYNMNYAQLVEI
jgi:general secretion pathway protein G